VPEVTVFWLTAFLDTEADAAPDAETYWSAVTGWPVSSRRGPDREFATLEPPDGDSPLKVQVVGTAPANGMHLDVHTDDVDGLVGDATRLGADLHQVEEGFVTGHSPGGLPFCVVEHAASIRPSPVSWPGGTSLVDQVCLDIPTAQYDAEAQFWSLVTGWPHVEGGSPEFDRLLPPAGQPLRVLLQRVEEDDGPVRMHLDLASEHRAAEVERHVGLGGRVVRTTQNWTTLLDPSGRAYCVTDRDPVRGTIG
jgi:hypothetical protein